MRRHPGLLLLAMVTLSAGCSTSGQDSVSNIVEPARSEVPGIDRVPARLTPDDDGMLLDTSVSGALRFTVLEQAGEDGPSWSTTEVETPGPGIQIAQAEVVHDGLVVALECAGTIQVEETTCSGPWSAVARSLEPGGLDALSSITIAESGVLGTSGYPRVRPAGTVGGSAFVVLESVGAVPATELWELSDGGRTWRRRTAPVGARDQVCVDTNGVVVSAAVDQSGPAAGTARPGETSTSAPTREIGLTFAPLDGADTDVHQRSLEVARSPDPPRLVCTSDGPALVAATEVVWIQDGDSDDPIDRARVDLGSPADDLAFRLVGWSPTSPIVTVADSGAGQIELTAASTDGPVGDSVTRLQDDETLRSAAFDRASETFLGVVSEPVPGHGPDRTAAIISVTAGG